MTLTALQGFSSGAALAKKHAVPDTRLSASQREALLSEERPVIAELPLSSGKSILIETEGPPPDWLLHVLHDLQCMSMLKENWDGYGAQRISDISIVGAVQFLAAFLPNSGVKPSIVPTSTGGVQLEWHRGGADIEVSIGPRGAVSVYYHVLATEESEEAQFPDRQRAMRLRQILASM